MMGDVALALACGLAYGGAVGLAWGCILRKGSECASPYGQWLGRTCWVRPHGRDTWHEHVVVAVSWAGSVCVRDVAKPGSEGYWIKKQNVSWRVRWDAPGKENA